MYAESVELRITNGLVSVLECKAWNTLEEIVISQATASKPDSLKDLPASKVQNLTEVKSQNKDRLSTGLSELDRTLGGGLVDGSVVLIGGDPGIGKSTSDSSSASNPKQSQYHFVCERRRICRTGEREGS